MTMSSPGSDAGVSDAPGFLSGGLRENTGGEPVLLGQKKSRLFRRKVIQCSLENAFWAKR